MPKHLADHQRVSNGGRVKNFLRIARDRSEFVWRAAWQRPLDRGNGNRRIVQFVRIAKGREV